MFGLNRYSDDSESTRESYDQHRKVMHLCLVMCDSEQGVYEALLGQTLLSKIGSLDTTNETRIVDTF